MIPKIIHYCWFGPKPIPKEQQEFIEKWSYICPDWQIMFWNENNFDISSHPFTKKSYELKKYAFVTDFVRVWVLNEFGGVYLDTDVELKKNIDGFLEYEAFSCFEKKGIPFTSAVWGSQRNHSLLINLLDYYKKEYDPSENPNTITISKILAQNFNIDSNNDFNQIGYDGKNKIHIFSSHYFCLDLPENYASHHFCDSWSDFKKNIPYKRIVHDQYFIEKISINDQLTKDCIRNLSKKIKLKDILLIIRYYLKNKLSI